MHVGGSNPRKGGREGSVNSPSCLRTAEESSWSVREWRAVGCGVVPCHIQGTSTKYTTDTYRTKFGEREFVTCIKQEQVPSSAFADTQVIYEVVRGVCEGGVCEGRYVRGVCEGGVCEGRYVRGECV